MHVTASTVLSGSLLAQMAELLYLVVSLPRQGTAECGPACQSGAWDPAAMGAQGAAGAAGVQSRNDATECEPVRQKWRMAACAKLVPSSCNHPAAGGCVTSHGPAGNVWLPLPPRWCYVTVMAST
eukprot:GHRQ01016438.1.p3 GENE.GHRQ01016438.1~~GHRQ01016438.1.p3  ORF type:complete len:125 (-),score=16.05 GHRQ01016438.1:494-868(-)